MADDDARPILLHSSTYWQPQVKGLTLMVNSSHDGQRFEDLWLGK